MIKLNLQCDLRFNSDYFIRFWTDSSKWSLELQREIKSALIDSAMQSGCAQELVFELCMLFMDSLDYKLRDYADNVIKKLTFTHFLTSNNFQIHGEIFRHFEERYAVARYALHSISFGAIHFGFVLTLLEYELITDMLCSKWTLENEERLFSVLKRVWEREDIPKQLVRVSSGFDATDARLFFNSRKCRLEFAVWACSRFAIASRLALPAPNFVAWITNALESEVAVLLNSFKTVSGMPKVYDRLPQFTSISCLIQLAELTVLNFFILSGSFGASRLKTHLGVSAAHKSLLEFYHGDKLSIVQQLKKPLQLCGKLNKTVGLVSAQLKRLWMYINDAFDEGNWPVGALSELYSVLEDCETLFPLENYKAQLWPVVKLFHVTHEHSWVPNSHVASAPNQMKGWAQDEYARACMAMDTWEVPKQNASSVWRLRFDNLAPKSKAARYCPALFADDFDCLKNKEQLFVLNRSLLESLTVWGILDGRFSGSRSSGPPMSSISLTGLVDRNLSNSFYWLFENFCELSEPEVDSDIEKISSLIFYGQCLTFAQGASLKAKLGQASFDGRSLLQSSNFSFKLKVAQHDLALKREFSDQSNVDLNLVCDSSKYSLFDHFASLDFLSFKGSVPSVDALRDLKPETLAHPFPEPRLLLMAASRQDFLEKDQIESLMSRLPDDEAVEAYSFLAVASWKLVCSLACQFNTIAPGLINVNHFKNAGLDKKKVNDLDDIENVESTPCSLDSSRFLAFKTALLKNYSSLLKDAHTNAFLNRMLENVNSCVQILIKCLAGAGPSLITPVLVSRIVTLLSAFQIDSCSKRLLDCVPTANWLDGLDQILAFYKQDLLGSELWAILKSLCGTFPDVCFQKLCYEKLDSATLKKLISPSCLEQWRQMLNWKKQLRALARLPAESLYFYLLNCKGRIESGAISFEEFRDRELLEWLIKTAPKIDTSGAAFSLLQTWDLSTEQQLDALIFQVKEITHKFKHIPFPSFPEIDGRSGWPFTQNRRDSVWLSECEDNVMVIGTKTLPKRMVALGGDGRKYPFLVKYSEDLKQDYNIQSLFRLFNKIVPLRYKHLNVATYTVIPLSKKLGMVEWVRPAVSLHHIHKEYVGDAEKPPSEFLADVCAQNGLDSALLDLKQSEWPDVFARRVHETMLAASKGSKLALRDYICQSYMNSSDWRWAQMRYCQSLASMSIIGWFLGIGDRHLDNILFRSTDGAVVHIDFNICFDRPLRLAIPETVPFRITRMLKCALGPLGFYGPFYEACKQTLCVLQSHMSLLYDHLLIFVLAPVEQRISLQSGCKVSADHEAICRAFYRLTNSKVKLDNPTAKLPLFASFDNVEISNNILEDHLDALLTEATSPLNLSRMFFGWKFWV